MKPVVHCELLETPVVGQGTLVRRTSEHPRLGQPKSSPMVTSRVLRVDAENKIVETLNTLYLY